MIVWVRVFSNFGINYRSENKEDDYKFLEFKLASVLRNEVEDNIPTQTTLNKKIQFIWLSWLQFVWKFKFRL